MDDYILNNLYSHHLDSFDHFIEEAIPSIFSNHVSKLKTVTGDTVEVYLENPKLHSPHITFRIQNDVTGKLTPEQAVARRMDYSGLLTAEMVTRNGDNITRRHVEVCKIPIPVRSKYCHLRQTTGPAGYFIVSGQERVIITQEMIAYNSIMVFRKQKAFQAELHAQAGGNIQRIYVRETNGIFTITFSGNRRIYNLASFVPDMSDRDIIKYMSPDESDEWINLLRQTLIERSGEQMNESDDRYGLEPFFNCETEKRGFLALQMMRELGNVILGHRPSDDRDSYANKRYRPAGEVLEMSFQYLYEKMMYDMVKTCQKSAVIQFRSAIMTNGFKYMMSTGSFAWKNGLVIGKKAGVTQIYNRFNHISSMSHLRRIINDVDTSNKVIDPRAVHPSQLYFICVAETPEGASIGLTKNLAISASVSTSTHFPPLDQLGLYAEEWSVGSIAILLNGVLIGFTTDSTFATKLRNLRRQYLVSRTCSVVQKHGVIEIRTDSGRLYRPVVENGSIVDYIDVVESSSGIIVPETDPSLMFGVAASMIPYANHNQSPRVIYQTSMCKQAISLPMPEYRERFDTNMHILWYPQKPLVYTRMSSLLGMDQLPTGQNVSVAFMCYSGYNQEDSILVNRAAIDRGLFTISSFRSYRDEETKNKTTLVEDALTNPLEIEGCRLQSKNREVYRHLNNLGFVEKETFLNSGDAVIGKVSPDNHHTTRQLTDIHFRDSSTFIKNRESGYMDKIQVTYGPSGAKIVKVRMRQERILKVGDKLASCSAQKGVIGRILDPEDMPYDANGQTPDLIINAHAIPSRMTVAQLMEMVMGAKAAEHGMRVDASVFNNPDISRVQDTELFNGVTGERFQTRVFFGMCYYQRLKHLVDDKFYAHNFGVVQNLTRQPKAGRAKNGALRVGNMELDCFVSHGAARTLYEKFFKCSDEYYVNVCGDCGRFCAEFCTVCGSGTIVEVGMPYSSKLFFYELQCMGIDVNFKTM